jgi:hypothetical protein
MKIHDVAFWHIQQFDQSQLERSLGSSTTLVVDAASPGVEVAIQADQKDAHLIILTDEKQGVCGVLAPAEFKQKVQHHRGKMFSSLEEAILDLATDPLEIGRGFHHEWLNHDRPSLFWCDQGQHMTDETPCSIHGRG